MKNRRYFLKQGTLATTAILALKPLTGIARLTSPFTGFSGSNGKLVFLHTANQNPFAENKAIQYINEIKSNHANTIVLKAGQEDRDETGTGTYDAAIPGSDQHLLSSRDYKIITRGNHRTGIISADPGEDNIIQKINRLSAYLKKEKNCDLVVCLSRLGYKNKTTPDDITLAKRSFDLDIIIGGHAENFHTHPTIALNSNDGEVIIHSASGDPVALGKIEIDIDWRGRKKFISFSSQS